MPDYMIEVDGSAPRTRRVEFPIQVPRAARISIHFSNDAVLSGVDLKLEKEDRAHRIDKTDDRIVVFAYPGEVVHARWVEPGGDPVKDLPPDPAHELYYIMLQLFDPSAFSRRMSFEVRWGGEIVDVTEPFVFRRWLDSYYPPQPNRPLHMALDIGIGVPAMALMVAAFLFDVGWAMEVLVWATMALLVLGAINLARLLHSHGHFRGITRRISGLARRLTRR